MTLLDVQYGAVHAGVVGASRARVADVGLNCCKLSPKVAGMQVAAWLAAAVIGVGGGRRQKLPPQLHIVGSN